MMSVLQAIDKIPEKTIRRILLAALFCLTLVVLNAILVIPIQSDQEPVTRTYHYDGNYFDVEYDEIVEYYGILNRSGIVLNAYTFVTPNDPVLKKFHQTLIPHMEGMDQTEKATFLLNIVGNNIYYKTDDSLHSREYTQFPSETLLSGMGDCEDYSILLYNLYVLTGLNCTLVYSDNHVSVGVSVDHDGSKVRNLIGEEFVMADATNYIRLGASFDDDNFALKPWPTIALVMLSCLLLTVLVVSGIRKEGGDENPCSF